MPGFVKALEPVVGTDTSLILTYPNLTACDPSCLEGGFGAVARRQNGALTALIVADARLVRFGRADQDGVRVAFASLFGVRFCAALSTRRPPFSLLAESLRQRGDFTPSTRIERGLDGVEVDTPSRRLTRRPNYNADNDGYALDPHFACELVGALEARDSTYVVARPMLYESKADGSLAAHATQTKLRWQDGVQARPFHRTSTQQRTRLPGGRSN